MLGYEAAWDQCPKPRPLALSNLSRRRSHRMRSHLQRRGRCAGFRIPSLADFAECCINIQSISSIIFPLKCSNGFAYLGQLSDNASQR
jgi:hypothetical protein